MTEKQAQTLALFDFDGTLTTTDSLGDFIQFSVGKTRTAIGSIILSPALVAYTLRLKSNSDVKQKILKHFFGGWEKTHFQKVSQDYSTMRIPKILRLKGINKLKWHQENGHKVVIVSASIEDWLKPWTDQLGIDLIGTRLQYCNGKITGKFLGKNCHGVEKTRRVQKYLNLNSYQKIFAYGDTKGDRPLLDLADHQFYKPFR